MENKTYFTKIICIVGGQTALQVMKEYEESHLG